MSMGGSPCGPAGTGNFITEINIFFSRYFSIKFWTLIADCVLYYYFRPTTDTFELHFLNII